MTDWRDANLGEVVEIKYGKDHKHLSTGKIPLYGSGGVMRYVDTALYDDESILIPRKGSLNNIIYESNPFWTVDTMFWSKIDKTLAFPKFLFYQLSVIDYMNLNVGSAVPSLTVPVINAIEISLPPLQDQKSIASVLSSLDDKIDLLHRQNKTLEAMAETLFRQWFVEGAGEDCPITDLVDFNPTRKLSKGAIVPYLEMAALSTTVFNPEGWYDREFTSGMKFINGDTLLARITPCLENGKTGYVTFLAVNQVGWGSTEYIVMRPVKMLHTLFAYVLARNQVFREYAEGCMAGSSGRQRVDIEHLKQFEICKPTNDAVSAFNEMARSVAPKLHANMVQIKTLEKLRDGLLPKLMSGEVRVA